MTQTVTPLHKVSGRDAQWAGAKAAILGELLCGGFPVPDGFVVSGFDFDESSDLIAEAWRRLGGKLVAVRSSAVEEDLSDASFAGQYESILGVDSAEKLLAAVHRCRSSDHSERVRAYSEAHGRTGGGPLAVLVQTQVEADAAGIAFTANPVTGDPSQVVVNAVEGLGDLAASGEVTPQQWLVRDDGTTELVSGGPAGVTSSQAGEVARLARRVEAHFGTPQDIEWAIADGVVYLLQARPITALPEYVEPVPVSVDVPEGYWQRDAGHAPQPNTPLYSSMVLPHASVAGQAWFAEYGFLMDGMEWREIGGWQYIGLRPLGGKARRPPPSWLVPVLRRLIPPLRSRVQECVEAVRSDRAGHNLQRWYEEWKPDLRSRAETLRAVPLADLADDELSRHLETVSSLIADALRIHFILHGAGFLHLGELVFACRELLGWDDRETIDLLSGLSGTSTEPAAKLNELAQQAAGNTKLLSVLDGVDPSLDDIGQADPAFASALQSYLDEYGYRALRYELVDPTLNETPELVLQILGHQIASGFDPERNLSLVREQADALLEEARRVLEGHPSELERFERALQRARIAYPVREDSEFFTVSLPLGLARLGVLELGDRLATRGQIANRNDVFFLEYDETRSLLASGSEVFDPVRRRKGERAWSLAHPGPGSYGADPGPPPSFIGFPPEVRFAMGALLWAVDRAFETDRSAQHQQGEGRIIGIAASPGSYTGTARRVMDETQFDKIRAGDVLVCPITSPVWSVVFPSLGALVADTGGILSHPAIIAREYRIPAVVATGNATSLISDGQPVTVDGTTGVVAIG